MLALLDAFQRDKFQSAVIAGLGLIYVAIRSVGLGLMMLLQQTGRVADAEFANIRHLLNDQTIDKAATVQRALNTMRVDNAKAIINMVFLAINALMCVLVLLAAMSK